MINKLDLGGVQLKWLIGIFKRLGKHVKLLPSANILKIPAHMHACMHIYIHVLYTDPACACILLCNLFSDYDMIVENRFNNNYYLSGFANSSSFVT